MASDYGKFGDITVVSPHLLTMFLCYIWEGDKTKFVNDFLNSG